MQTRSCLRSFEEPGVLRTGARRGEVPGDAGDGRAGRRERLLCVCVFVVLTVTFSTAAEAKIVLMRFAAEPLFLFDTRPCRPVKFASFLRTGRRETAVMWWRSRGGRGGL